MAERYFTQNEIEQIGKGIQQVNLLRTKARSSYYPRQSGHSRMFLLFTLSIVPGIPTLTSCINIEAQFASTVGDRMNGDGTISLELQFVPRIYYRCIFCIPDALRV